MTIFGAITLVSYFFVSCGGGKGGSNFNGDLAAEANDFVNMAIAVGCNEAYQKTPGMNYNNKNALANYTEDLSKLIARYQNSNWRFDFNFKPEVSFSVDKTGKMKTDFLAPITSGGYFIGKYDTGKNKYEIKFTDGKIGLLEGNVYIEENTKLSVNGTPYVFKNNTWIKDNR